MRLMLHSNASWSPSGYGVQSKLFAPRLRDMGHDVAISSFYGLQSGVLEWDGIRHYPNGLQPYGTDIAGAHVQHFGAKALIALMDAWVLGPLIKDCQESGTALVLWSPVDQAPVPREVRGVARHAHTFACYSKWGTDEALRSGIEQSVYVPLGVDAQAMRPMDKAEARERVGLPRDAFIAGIVAANKCPFSRKAWAQQLEGFARFAELHPDAHLYIHGEITRAHGGWPVDEMLHDFGLAGNVTVADRYLLHVGFDAAHMRAVFSSLDVLLSASAGEGFGVPIVEAQACGTPVICGDWTSMSELHSGAGVLIDKDDAFAWRTPQGGDWYYPRPAAVAAALEEVYRVPGVDWPGIARRFAQQYDATLITDRYWRPLLERLDGEMIGREAPAALPEPEVVEVGG